MEDLQKQVSVARRRLFWQRLVAALPWCLSCCLLIAAAAIAAPKIWTMPTVDPSIWPWAWLGGAIVVGISVALGLAYLRRPDSIQTAIELDQRFGLKERVSSCLALSPDEQATEVGQALMRDAMRRVSKVNVSERFRVQADRWLALPFGLAVAAFALTLLSDAQPDPTATAQAATLTVKKRVQNSTDSLKKKIEERKKQALEEGLPEASELFDKLEKGVESIKQKGDTDRQKTLVKLNDLARDLQERQKELMNRDEMQKQLSSLKDIKQGPAEKMAQAMKDGDFKAALNELKEIQDKLAKGEMSKQDQEKLQEQLNQMKDKLQSLAEAQESAKRELEKQIQQKLAQGDRQAAGKLQNKLDQLMQKDAQAKQMNKLAEKLAAASEAMQQGNAKDAAAQLGEMASDLEGMQQEMAEMEMLDDALAQIASAKDAMACENCDGMGCSMCQGDMTGNGFGNGKGDKLGGRGMGEGRGEGDRPESETDTGFYESQVRAKPGRGKAIVTGAAPGKNKAGQALEEIKVEIEAGRHSTDDPLTGQRLPKPQRELTREYFDAFREGE